jgi:hypothetical protein
MKKLARVLSLILALSFPLTFLSCAEDDEYNTGFCIDKDEDGHGLFCYLGDDCDDSDYNNWASCEACKDSDGDNWYTACDRYHTINGPDCDDSDENNWESCATCTDADFDSWFTGCDAYITINGEDCEDSNPDVYPDAPEYCDCIDNQCPGDPGYGQIDEGCLITWSKTYGGSEGDGAHAIQQTSDGGYIVAGYTYSFGASGEDYWVLKLDACGNVIWDKTYVGGQAWSVDQTQDGGYVLAGNEGVYKDSDIYKLDESGNETWGYTWRCEIYSIQQTFDGGYIVGGSSEYTSLLHYWIMIEELDADGKSRGEGICGSPLIPYRGGTAVQTQDGSYIQCGDFVVKWYEPGWGLLKFSPEWTVNRSKSYSIQQTQDLGYIAAGPQNFRIFKLNEYGGKVWDKTFCENGGVARFVQEFQAGGYYYIVAGYADSVGAGSEDFYILKLNESGTKIWDKTYGGTDVDKAYSIQHTEDGGFVVAGETNSFGAGDYDVWILKLDKNGHCTGLGCPE